MKLIIDIGGTRGRWYIIDKSIIFSFETEGFNPFTSNISALRKILEDLKNSFDFNSIKTIYYYGAGISSEDKTIEVKNLLQTFFVRSTIELNSDLLGSCRALCDNKEGVVCILGTGSNSCYYDGKKIVHKINSLGHLLGDEGSGYDMGKKFLIKYLRDELTEDIKIHFSKEFDVSKNILERLYISNNREKFIASISKFVSENKENDFVHAFIHNHFNKYFDKIILKYSCKNVYMTGSVAHYFKNEIEKTAKEKGYTINKIVKDPIKHLCDFHIK